jgi:hypothetical protein
LPTLVELFRRADAMREARATFNEGLLALLDEEATKRADDVRPILPHTPVAAMLSHAVESRTR